MLDRTIAPTFKKIDFVPLQWPKKCQLNEAIPIFVLNAGSQPIVKLEVVFKAGSWYEPQNGVAYFTAKMLKEGTKRKSALEIATCIDQYGASLGIVAEADFLSIHLVTLSRYFDKMLSLLRELLFEPTFPAHSLELLKNIKTQAIKVNNEKNNRVAQKELKAALFGKRHPYGKYLTEEEVARIESDSLKSYYQQQLFAGCEIFMSGQIEDAMIEVVKQHLQELSCQKSTPSPSSLTKSITKVPTKIQRSTKKESMQSSIRIGKTLFTKQHEDYIPMLFLNELLGGYWGSRLMQNIREEKGYTYGIFSSIVPFRHASCFLISTDVIQSFTQQALEEIYREINLLQKQAITPEELQKLKNYMLGTFLSEINDPFSLMEKFKAVYLYGLSQDYYQQYYTTICNMDALTLMELANKHLTIDSLSEVVVD